MSTPDVKIYSSANCAFCMRAKSFLDKKQVPYEEIRVDQDAEQRQKMVEITGLTSVPQIFIGEQHVGGYTDMVELDVAGDLDPLLGKA